MDTGILVMECITATANPIANKVCGKQKKRRANVRSPVILAEACEI